MALLQAANNKYSYIIVLMLSLEPLQVELYLAGDGIVHMREREREREWERETLDML